MSSHDIVGLYERHAARFDLDRGRSLQEKGWLDRFLSYVRDGGTILDLGCGMGEPIARYLLERGYQVLGVDSSPSLIALCRSRFPASEWIVDDMRALHLHRRFEGILAWDSFFHLSGDDQRLMFPGFASHAEVGAPLMFTSGPREGEAIGSYAGEPLFHASLHPEEYRRLLAANGFSVRQHVAEDPDCGVHTVWLATHDTAVLSSAKDSG
jgi:SAM-dependent methyltransferase